MSRSALIRGFVVDGLEHYTASSVGERIADGYRRIPPAEPDGWGELDGSGDATTGDLLTRLDAEERAAGHDPW